MSRSREIINFSFGMRILTTVMYALGRLLVSLPVHALYGLRIRGRRNLRSLGLRGFVTVSNHCLYGEPIFAGMALWPRCLWYCAEQKNVERSYIGWLCRVMGAFGIPEDRPLSIAGPVRRALEKGHVVHIYPEGELYWRNQDIGPFLKGAFFFSLTSGAPVLPMTAVLKERKAWSLFRWLPPRVDYVIGKPIFPDAFLDGTGNRREALAAYADAVRSSMQTTIDSGGGIRDLPGVEFPAVTSPRSV